MPLGENTQPLKSYMERIKEVIDNKEEPITAKEIGEELDFKPRRSISSLIRDYGEHFGIKKIKRYRSSMYFYYTRDDQLDEVIVEVNGMNEAYPRFKA